ncbi:Flp1 family type IVb pilin [Paenibacillus daejeonensis]|uniref:Flp1 family type IVb pilin n=1 Tax=Paenibacillus daejeonensis TaxID=135193 RepID=UPI00037E1A5E|nr:Flp1 family type IVb pilin [Paenibacillus daejeonensis]
MENMKQAVKQFWNEEDGIGTLEIVLIIAVVILIALIFKDWIIGLVNSLLGEAEGKANEIFD